MVATAPNLTLIAGRLAATRPSTAFPGWAEADVVLDVVEAVPGLACLVRSRPGDTVTVAVAPGLLPPEPAGCGIRCRVAVTPSGLRAEPHPTQEHFSLSQP